MRIRRSPHLSEDRAHEMRKALNYDLNSKRPIYSHIWMCYKDHIKLLLADNYIIKLNK